MSGTSDPRDSAPTTPLAEAPEHAHSGEGTATLLARLRQLAQPPRRPAEDSEGVAEHTERPAA